MYIYIYRERERYAYIHTYIHAYILYSHASLACQGWEQIPELVALRETFMTSFRELRLAEQKNWEDARVAFHHRRFFLGSQPRTQRGSGSELHKKGHMTTGHRLCCQEFLCFRNMPCRHMPLLVHFWGPNPAYSVGVARSDIVLDPDLSERLCFDVMPKILEMSTLTNARAQARTASAEAGCASAPKDPNSNEKYR